MSRSDQGKCLACSEGHKFPMEQGLPGRRILIYTVILTQIVHRLGQLYSICKHRPCDEPQKDTAINMIVFLLSTGLYVFKISDDWLIHFREQKFL